MDMHTHIADEGQSADPGAPLKSTPARDAFIGARNAWDTVRAGFTTVRDVGVYRGLSDVALRDAIKAGQVPGPRMYVAGAYITITGGGGEITGLPKGTVVPAEYRLGVADNEQQVRQKVNFLFDHGADFIKVIATGAVLTAGTDVDASEYTEAEIHAAVEEAARHHSFVAAHAHGAEGIKRAVRAGVRSIEHGSLIDDEGIALMKQHGTWLVADIYNGDYIDTVGPPAGLVGRDPAKEHRHHRTPAPGLPQGRGRRRQHRLRHRQRRVSARRQRAPVRLHGALRADADAGDPVGDDQPGAPARARTRDRFDRAGQGRRPDRRLRRPDREHRGAARRQLR